MRSFWKIAVPIACVAAICCAVFGWRLYDAKTNARRLAEDARECRVHAEQGDAKAQSKLGSIYYYGRGVPQDYAEALRWYRKAADQGDANAQDGLAYMYFQGQGVPKDYTEAVRLYRKAAEQGNSKAEYDLGYMYAQGQGVPRDYAEATHWYRKAADQGYAWAQDSLGFQYYYGQGVPRDYAESAGWFRKAADQGDARGQYGLGHMYYIGDGVPRNYAEAVFWYAKAADQGDERAERALNTGLSRDTEVLLSITILGSMFLLMSSYRAGGLFDPQQRGTTLTGLLGLSYAAFDMYGLTHAGTLHSLWAVSAFYFARFFLQGTFLAMLILLVWHKGTKILLSISGTLFAGINIFWVALYALRHATPSIRLFYLPNGLFVGMSIPSAVSLWLAHRKRNDKSDQTRSLRLGGT